MDILLNQADRLLSTELNAYKLSFIFIAIVVWLVFRIVQIGADGTGFEWFYWFRKIFDCFVKIFVDFLASDVSLHSWVFELIYAINKTRE